MPTKLFLRNSTTNGITGSGDGILYDLLTTAGASLDTAVTNTTASGTEIQATKTAGGSTIAWISGRAPAGGFTLTTTDISLWQQESNMNANIGGRYRIFKRTAAGVITELGGGPFDDLAEMATSNQEDTWVGNPTDTAFAEDDRILIRYYLTNIGTMGASFTGTMSFNAPDASTGDSFFNIAETVVFKSDPISVALTGVSTTSSVGSLGKSLTTPLTGSSATSAVGTVTPGSGGSTLFTGCVAAWKLSDLTDATGRGNTLTNNNSATFNTGKIGSAVYTAAASSQYLSKASSADVQMGDVDFTLAFWAYGSSFGATSKHIVVSKDASGQREYYIHAEDQGASNYRFVAASFSGGAEKVVVANNFGDLSTATWYCVIVWWDATTQTLNISVNDGTANTNSVGADLDAVGTAQFRIGARQFSGFENYWDGRIDAVHIWKRVLTSGERTEFYNSGTGVEFSAGSPDVSLALTGVSATSNSGSLGIDRTTPLAGSSSTALIGILGPTRSVSITGNVASASIGSLTVNQSIGLLGVGASASMGTLIPSRTVSISGNSATSAVGTLTPVIGVNVALTGVSATASVGSLAPSNTRALTGVSVTSGVGTLTPSTGVFVALTGVQATTSIGVLSPSLSKGLTGNSATSAIGSLSIIRSITLTGVSATTAVGTFSPSLTISITGVSALTAIGTLSILSDDTLAVSTNVGSGILFTAHVGTGELRTSDAGTMTITSTDVGASLIVYQDVRTDT